MSSNSSLTKEKIIDAAIALFNTKGYSGTSVREISQKANVNVAHISYYFNSKGGLLEFLVSQFYEGYLARIDLDNWQQTPSSAKEILNQMIWDILLYQHKNRQLTRFVYREITLDTVLIREVMTTYLAKEKYLFRNILERGKTEGEFLPVAFPHMFVQLKGMLMMPFLQGQYLSEVLHLQVHDEYFLKQYYHDIKNWLDHFLYKQTVEKVAL
ncbi:forespore capture DNA-binding protein RefZ [Bacillus kexueae]|uniref:forespore capture DNA-binding protein RefZ n=1 Tax=Aeribacillus kexueae TaxID=2078952 RepID=UPI001FB02A4B|nr:forespore capture DNA-binding protein RefZ [Bacillus kexueae]